MLNPAVLLLGIVVSQAPVVEEAGPVIPRDVPMQPSPEAPIAPLPMAETDEEAEEVSPLERQPRDRREIPNWGWRNAADGWYPSTRDMRPYIEPHFPRLHHKPAWSWSHWWCSPHDMIPHFAYYPTLHSYYYSRPYHTMHLPYHEGVADSYGLDPRNPYDNKIFERVYESLKEERANKEALDLVEPTTP